MRGRKAVLLLLCLLAPGFGPAFGQAALCVDDYRSLRVTGFAAASEEALLNFSLLGVSLQTPWDEIGDILKGQGFDEEGSPRPDTFRKYIKGSRTPQPGEDAFEFSIRRDGTKQEISFRRRTGDGRVSTSGPATYSQQPLTDTADVLLVKQIKKLVCDGIADPIERFDACTPDQEKMIELGDRGKETIKLSSRLEVSTVRAMPLVTSITLRSCD